MHGGATERRRKGRLGCTVARRRSGLEVAGQRGRELERAVARCGALTRSECEAWTSRAKHEAACGVPAGVQRWVSGCFLYAGRSRQEFSVCGEGEKPSRAGVDAFRSTRQPAAAGPFRRPGPLHRGNVRDGQAAVSGRAVAANGRRAVVSVRIAAAENAHRNARAENHLLRAERCVLPKSLTAQAMLRRNCSATHLTAIAIIASPFAVVASLASLANCSSCPADAGSLM